MAPPGREAPWQVQLMQERPRKPAGGFVVSLDGLLNDFRREFGAWRLLGPFAPWRRVQAGSCVRTVCRRSLLTTGLIRILWPVPTGVRSKDLINDHEFIGGIPLGIECVPISNLCRRVSRREYVPVRLQLRRICRGKLAKATHPGMAGDFQLRSKEMFSS